VVTNVQRVGGLARPLLPLAWTLAVRLIRIVAIILLEIVSASVCPLLAPLFYWRLLTGDLQDVATLPTGDITELHYPYRRWVAEQLARGESPWWNQFVSAGHSAVGDIQFHIMYPPDNFLATYAGGSLPLRTFEVGIVGHVALAGFFTYLLGRRLSGSRIGGIVAGLVFAFGGYLTGFTVQQMILLEASIWLPLILLAIDIGAGFNVVTAFVVGSGAVALAALAGHPQTFFYVVVASASYALFRAWNSGRPRLAAILGVPILFVAGLALAANTFIPALLHLSLTDRTNVTYAFSNPGFGLHEVIGIVFPTEFGGAPLYNGVFTLVLIGIALAARYRRSDKLFWSGLGIAGLLFSFGGNTFLESIPYLALGSFKFRDHERLSLFVSMSVAVLAAYGAAELARSAPIRVAWLRRWIKWPLGLLGALIVLNLFEQPIVPQDHFQALIAPVDRVAFTGIVVVLGAALVLGRERRILHPSTAGLLAVALVGFDLFSTNWQNNLRPGEPEKLLEPSPIVEYLQSYATGVFRIASEGQLPGDGNAGALYRLEDIVGNSPLETKDYADFDKTVPEIVRWQILNVRYIVTQRKMDDPRFHLLRQDGPRNLYELDDTVQLPRVIVVDNVIPAPSHKDALELLKTADVQNEVVLEGAPDLRGLRQISTPASPGASPTTSNSPLAPPPARLESEDANEVVVEVQQDRPGVLVLSDVDYPGWHAAIDGSETTIYRTNGIVRGVMVPAGQHKVRFWFQPEGLALGEAISSAIPNLLLEVIAAESVLRLLWFVAAAILTFVVHRQKLDVRSAEPSAQLLVTDENAKIGGQE
jgi:hypothetical protein